MKETFDKDGIQHNLIEESDLDWEEVKVEFDPDIFNIREQKASINKKINLIRFRADVTTKVGISSGNIGTIENKIAFQSFNCGYMTESKKMIYSFSCNGSGTLVLWQGSISANERLLFSFVEMLL